MRKPIEFADFPAAVATRCAYGPYRAVIKAEVDGDTLYALCDVGLNDYPFKEFRLARINAPERFKGSAEERARGDAAWRYLLSIVPEGTAAAISTTPDPDKYLRYIAEVTLADGTNVSDALVAAGHAEYHRYS